MFLSSPHPPKTKHSSKIPYLKQNELEMLLKTNHLGIVLLALFIAVLSACSNKIVHNDVVPPHDSFTIESTKMGETRVIAVWTPPEYQVGEEHFPVLYMPDGGVKEDFPHVAQTLSKLIDAKSIPPMILVGIENTERGRDLTGFSDTK